MARNGREHRTVTATRPFFPDWGTQAIWPNCGVKAPEEGA